MNHHTQTPPARTATQRLVQALTDPDRLFDQAQVVHLMAAAQRWGYEARQAEETAADPLSHAAGWAAGYAQRVAEERATWPDPRVFDAHVIGHLGEIRAARAAAAADRTQRYAGGPVPVWDADRPDLPDLGPSARNWHPRAGVPLRRSGSGYVWAED